VCLSCAGRDCSIDVAERGANGGKAKLLSHYSPVETPWAGQKGARLELEGAKNKYFPHSKKYH